MSNTCADEKQKGPFVVSVDDDMPRENQKRGRRAKHKQDDIVKAPPKIKARLPSPVQQGAQPEETPAWPLLDPETRAYFEQIQTRILELENLGVGQDRPADDDLGEDDGACSL